MRNQKVLQNNQISWYDEGSTRLNYQMIFRENNQNEEENEQRETTADINQLLNERDAIWRERLEQVRNQAYTEGFDKGKTEGLEQARSEIDGKLSVIRRALNEAHQEWQKRRELLEPGLLDMAFQICESILGIPVENPAIRQTLEDNLTPLFQKIDERSKPLLWVAKEDFDFVKELKKEFSETMVLNIQTDTECNPGEFRLETNNEIVIQDFREMLDEFKKSLILPPWN